MATASQDHSAPKTALDVKIETLWLRYYNDTLYAKGVITLEEKNKMNTLIRKRAAGYER